MVALNNIPAVAEGYVWVFHIWWGLDESHGIRPWLDVYKSRWRFLYTFRATLMRRKTFPIFSAMNMNIASDPGSEEIALHSGTVLNPPSTGLIL